MIVRCEVDLSKPIQLTEEQKKELEAIAQMDDSEIDYSDIPPLTEEELKEFIPFKDFLKRRKHS